MENQNIIFKSVSEIKPYEKNAKTHPPKQIKQIARSIKEFGFNQPIVIDKNNVIIVGHGRLLAALELGLEKVPVMMVDLSPAKAKAYRLADNKLNESDWDMDLVVDELKELSGQVSDIEITGFDKDILDIDMDKKEAEGLMVEGDGGKQFDEKSVYMFQAYINKVKYDMLKQCKELYKKQYDIDPLNDVLLNELMDFYLQHKQDG